jgi:3-oxoacyl-[acyl-carrier protein] reductase
MRALVTGASRGIGRAVALSLLDEADARLALGVRDPASVTALLTAADGSLALPVDLSDPAQSAGLVERAWLALGGLDVVINCAGIIHYTAAAELSRAELLEQLELDFLAPWAISQAAARRMRDAGGGVIVNVASTLALRPAPLTAAYAAAKAALIASTRALALELAPQRVRVNAVAPGIIDTDMIRAPRAAGLDPAGLERQLDGLRRLHPLGRLGTVEEVADAVMFLVKNEFATGTVLVLDGGLTLAH